MVDSSARITARRQPDAFSLIELVVGLAIIAIMAVIGMNFIPTALEQHRASKVTAAQATLRNAAKQYLYDRANQTDYVFEQPASSSSYVYSYDPDAAAGPTLMAKAIDPRFPTMEVVMQNGRRGVKQCSRGTDASLWKSCDGWKGYL